MMKRWMVLGVTIALGVAGCGVLSRKSSLLLERSARGPMDEALLVAHRFEWKLDPVLQTQTKNGVEITVNQASRTFLDNFFANKKLFGAYAGRNPLYLENLVFYVKITNNSKDKIAVAPSNFVLVDDRGNQYETIGIDYVTAFGEASHAFATTARGMIEDARPGYFGVSLPVGKIVSAKPQGQYALLTQSALQTGYVYPGVMHDGLIVFWNPSTDATKMRLILTNIRTNFKADGFPETSIDFPFEFTATK